MRANKSEWRDPVKNAPAKPETMSTEGNFDAFRDLMRRVVKVKTPRAEKPTSASRAPVASS